MYVPRVSIVNATVSACFFRAVTVLLKDYLRELPDPLCTSSLYQMLMDAMSVQVADDDFGNAQLMFSIIDCLPAANQVGVITRDRLGVRTMKYLTSKYLTISRFKKNISRPIF